LPERQFLTTDRKQQVPMFKREIQANNGNSDKPLGVNYGYVDGQEIYLLGEITLRYRLHLILLDAP